VFKYFGPQLIFLTFFFLILELTFIPLLTIHGAKPDLFLILLTFYSFFIFPNRTPHFAVFIGLIRELYSGSFLGFETIGYGISGILLWFLVIKMDRQNPYNQGALLLFFSFTNLLLVSVLTICLTESSLTLGRALLHVGGVSIYTTLIAPLIFFIIRRFLNFSQRDLFSRSG